MASFAATYAARPKSVTSKPAQRHGNPTPQLLAGRKETVTRIQDADEERAIDPQQSFEVVQTLLLISLASICYLRYLLPESGFEDRDWANIPEDTHWRYEDFVMGVMPAGATMSEGQSRKSRKVKILAQNGSAAATKLMSWLDGVFDALRSGVLDRMQLSIILEKDKPSNVLESYTFKFTYKEHRLDGMVVSSKHGKPITLRDARSSLATLNRYIKSLTQDLPDLPPTRFLTVHVFYTDDCPQEYIAPGFRPSRDYSIFVPHNELWRMTEANAVDGNFGYYRFVQPSPDPGQEADAANRDFSVGLKVKYLAPITDAGIELENDDQIPDDIEFTRTISRIEDIGQEDINNTGSNSVIDVIQEPAGLILPQDLQRMTRVCSGQRMFPPTQEIPPWNMGLQVAFTQSSAANSTQTTLDSQLDEQGEVVAEYASTTDSSTDELLKVGPQPSAPVKGLNGTSSRRSEAPMPPPRPTKRKTPKKRSAEAGIESRQTQRKSARISARSPHCASQ